jgi:hypothetical protein
MAINGIGYYERNSDDFLFFLIFYRCSFAFLNNIWKWIYALRLRNLEIHGKGFDAACVELDKCYVKLEH